MVRTFSSLEGYKKKHLNRIRSSESEKTADFQLKSCFLLPSTFLRSFTSLETQKCGEGFDAISAGAHLISTGEGARASHFSLTLWERTQEVSSTLNLKREGTLYMCPNSSNIHRPPNFLEPHQHCYSTPPHHHLLSFSLCELPDIPISGSFPTSLHNMVSIFAQSSQSSYTIEIQGLLGMCRR